MCGSTLTHDHTQALFAHFGVVYISVVVVSVVVRCLLLQSILSVCCVLFLGVYPQAFGIARFSPKLYICHDDLCAL